MGRNKIPMRPIDDTKRRNGIFKKRLAGLTKKVREFSTLCDVDVCMICLGPTGDYQAWPSERSEVDRVIRRYMDFPESERKQRMVGLFDVLTRGKEKKTRLGCEKTPVTGFPAWDLYLNHCSSTELNDLLSTLDSKLALVNDRIQFLESKQRLDREEGGRVLNPWNSHHILSTYTKNEAMDDVKLPPLPTSCSVLPNLLPIDWQPAPIAIDFGGYNNFQPRPSVNSSAFDVFECDFATSNMLHNDLKPKYQQDFQNAQHLLYNPSCFNPHSQMVDKVMYQEAREPLPLLCPPNYDAFEVVNGFGTNFTKDTYPAAENRAPSPLSYCYVCNKGLQDERNFIYRCLRFCSLVCRNYHIDMDRAAARAEENAKALARNDWSNLEEEKRGNLFSL